MALRREKHDTPEAVTDELRNLDRNKQDKITFAGRAPIASDKGFLWVDYAASKLYVRHPNTGAWTAV